MLFFVNPLTISSGYGIVFLSQYMIMTYNILAFTQPIIALLLIVVVLLQQKGAGLGMTFGGSSNVYSTKRGFDKVLFNITIILSILFFGTALISLIF